MTELYRWKTDHQPYEFRRDLWILTRAIDRIGYLPVLVVLGSEFVLSAEKKPTPPPLIAAPKPVKAKRVRK